MNTLIEASDNALLIQTSYKRLLLEKSRVLAYRFDKTEDFDWAAVFPELKGKYFLMLCEDAPDLLPSDLPVHHFVLTFEEADKVGRWLWHEAIRPRMKDDLKKIYEFIETEEEKEDFKNKHRIPESEKDEPMLDCPMDFHLQYPSICNHRWTRETEAPQVAPDKLKQEIIGGIPFAFEILERSERNGEERRYLGKTVSREIEEETAKKLIELLKIENAPRPHDIFRFELPVKHYWPPDITVSYQIE
jgi:hypothetical protein